MTIKRRNKRDCDGYEMIESAAARCAFTDMKGERRCVWVADHTEEHWMGTQRAYQHDDAGLTEVVCPPDPPRPSRLDRTLSAYQKATP